jgi:hypothetical protein
VLSPRKGTTDQDVVLLKGKECAFLGRRGMACEVRKLRGGNYTKGLGLMAVVNRQVKHIQVPKPINLSFYYK